MPDQPASRIPPPKFIPLQINGAHCLQAVCRHYDIRHEAVDQLIRHLFGIAQAENMPAWERAGQLLPMNGRGDPWPADLDEAVPAQVRADFLQLAHDTVEIGLADFYGADTQRPSEFYEACKRMLKKHHIPCP